MPADIARGLLDLIIGGDLDDGLDQITEAVNARRNVLATQKAASIMVGDHVVFTDPKWRGVTAEVVDRKRSGTKFGVKLTITETRYVGRRALHPRSLWNVPVEFIERVESEAMAATANCERCVSPLGTDGRCTDETCPFSDYAQGDPHGWANHPERS